MDGASQTLYMGAEVKKLKGVEAKKPHDSSPNASFSPIDPSSVSEGQAYAGHSTVEGPSGRGWSGQWDPACGVASTPL